MTGALDTLFDKLESHARTLDQEAKEWLAGVKALRETLDQKRRAGPLAPETEKDWENAMHANVTKAEGLLRESKEIREAIRATRGS